MNSIIGLQESLYLEIWSPPSHSTQPIRPLHPSHLWRFNRKATLAKMGSRIKPFKRLALMSCCHAVAEECDINNGWKWKAHLFFVHLISKTFIYHTYKYIYIRISVNLHAVYFVYYVVYTFDWIFLLKSSLISASLSAKNHLVCKTFAVSMLVDCMSQQKEPAKLIQWKRGIRYHMVNLTETN